MNREDFLRELENVIKNHEYNKDATLTCISQTIGKTVYMKDLYNTLYFITQDEQFSKRVEQLIHLFRKGNTLFEKYMIDAINKAKEN